MITPNRRVLIIDDNPSIHDDFRKILAPVPQNTSSLDQMRSALFGEAPPASETANVSFEVDTADQGLAGLSMVMQSKQQERPYALAFVDMRMPPGWDGLETVEHLWVVDPDLQIIICSAYSDNPWDEIVKRLGKDDKLLILQKPFNAIEVWQMATALSMKWNLGIQVSKQLDSVSQLVLQRTAELVAAREELQRLGAKSQQAAMSSAGTDERLAAACAQTEYLAVLGREIHDPLTSIIAATDRLSHNGLTPGQRAAVSEVRKGVETARTLINELLRLAPVELIPESSLRAAQPPEQLERGRR
jgi:CheY-like chemotaxis protein